MYANPTPNTCFAPEEEVQTIEGPVEIQYIRAGDWVLSRNEKTGEQGYRRVIRAIEHDLPKEDRPMVHVYYRWSAVPNAMPASERQRWISGVGWAEAKQMLHRWATVQAAEPTSEGQVWISGIGWMEMVEVLNRWTHSTRITSTPEHPFWVNGVGWVEAAHLQPGQELEICDPDESLNRRRDVVTAEQDLALSGGRWTATVESVVEDSTGLQVYNLEVEDFHTYFVGGYGVWVHGPENDV